MFLPAEHSPGNNPLKPATDLWSIQYDPEILRESTAHLTAARLRQAPCWRLGWDVGSGLRPAKRRQAIAIQHGAHPQKGTVNRRYGCKSEVFGSKRRNLSHNSFRFNLIESKTGALQAARSRNYQLWGLGSFSLNAKLAESQ